MYRGEKNKLDSFRKEKQDERLSEREKERESEREIGEFLLFFHSVSEADATGALRRITQGIENSSGSWSLSARFVSRRAVENNPPRHGRKSLKPLRGVESRVQTNPLTPNPQNPQPLRPFAVPGSCRNYEHSVTIPTRLTG